MAVAVKERSSDSGRPEDFYRLTVPQYHEMIKNGILGEDDPVELLDGYLITKMSKNPPHRVCTGLLRDVLGDLLPPGYYLESQDPITLSGSEPEPDVAIVRGRRRDYLGRHPGAADTELGIEVAEDSLPRDRTGKRLVYARAGIPTYWIMNLIDGVIETHSTPGNTSLGIDYTVSEVVPADGVVPLVLSGKTFATIPAAEILP